MVHDREMQRTVAIPALSLYERTNLPVRKDLPIVWLIDWKVAYKGWHPKEAAPIVAYLKIQVLNKTSKNSRMTKTRSNLHSEQ